MMRSVVIAGLLVLAAGVLLVDHVRSQPPGPRGGPRGERRDGGGPPGDHPPPPPPIIQALDTDRDGELSADEIKAASTNLLKLDTNKDGILSREETRPAPGGRDGGPGGRGPRDPGRPGGPRGDDEGRGRGPGPGYDRGPGGPERDHGPGPHGKPPELGHVVPPFVRDGIDLNDEQKKQIAELESEVKEKLTKILTAEQKSKFEELLQRGPGDRPHPGPGEGRRGRPEEDRDRPAGPE